VQCWRGGGSGIPDLHCTAFQIVLESYQNYTCRFLFPALNEEIHDQLYLNNAQHILTICCFWGAGLTEGEKEEGARAKAALIEEAGVADGDEDGSGDEGGRRKNQFKNHLKANEAVSAHFRVLGSRLFCRVPILTCLPAESTEPIVMICSSRNLMYVHHFQHLSGKVELIVSFLFILSYK